MKYYHIPVEFYKNIEKHNNSVLLETRKFDSENIHSYLFTHPVDILEIYHLNDLPGLFKKIEQSVKEKCYVAGYLTYECGYHFEKVVDKFKSSEPIAWFGIYREPLIFNHTTGKWDYKNSKHPENSINRFYKINNLELGISRKEYSEKIKLIKNYIAAGDVYQINFTDKYTFDYIGSLTGLYRDLLAFQHVSYASIIKNRHGTILSLSPELFFRIEKDRITTKPMKGTILRGSTRSRDNRLKQKLANDTKNRAEMLMIVDLLRNDLGRICKINTIEVKELFRIETYETLHQMVSVIEGIIQPEVNYYNLFRALFPCGSVTGAPKIRAMEIIHELENEPRHLYTGSIGYFSPEGKVVFNVAIRTVQVRNEAGEMGVGSGIVWDSDDTDEYEECKLKGKFFCTQYESFQLIETMLWDRQYRLLDLHMDRLRASAKEFGFTCEIESIKSILDKEAQKFKKGKKYKVRLLLAKGGYTDIESSVLRESKTKRYKVIISDDPVHSKDKFLYHKTTQRSFYNRYRQKAEESGLAEIIFKNEKKEITEGTISNVFIKKDGYYYTPPEYCGLLGGVFRKYFLLSGKNIYEKVLYTTDLEDADEIYICNAVIGMLKVELVDS